MLGQTVKGLFPCPTCGSDELEAVWDGEWTNFLCHECWSCWHVQLGWIHRVDIATCPGCMHRPECLAQRAAAVEPASGGG